MKITKTTALLVMAVSLAGCAGKFVQPEQTAPHATLRLTSDQTGVFASGSLFALDDATCTTHQRMMASLNWATGRTQTLRIPVGQPIYLGFYADVIHGSAKGLEGKYCQSAISFVPEEGHTYDAKQIFDGNRCAADLKDAATQKKPVSAVRQSLPEACILGSK